MINMTVIKVKDIVKYLVGVTLVVAIVMSITRYFSNIDIKKQEDTLQSELDSTTQKLMQNPMIQCFSTTIVAMGMEDELMDSKDTQVKQEKETVSSTQKILETTLGVAKIKETGNKQEQAKQQVIEEQKKVEQAKADALVQGTKDELENKFTNSYGSVKIKNESKFDLTEDILKPNIDLQDKKDILIFHTHTCESYTASPAYNYEPTGTYRTTDLNFSVARVGTELENQLKSYGFEVSHNQTYHDYPAYTGSYNRSLKTVQETLAKKPETQVVFDLHRDAVGAKNNYAPTVTIDGEEAAKIMFVMGTNGGGLDHPNWQQNLKFAVKVQEKANEMYPGLFKPIILRNSRYNQNVTNAASIIEVGATGNTLDQCLVSMKYLAKVMSEVMK